MTSEVSVVPAPDHHRYEAYVDDQLAGYVAYRLDDGVIDLVHTEVDDAFEGRGVGSALARGTLDDLRRDGSRRVVASCPFISEWIERHDDYADLVRPS